MSHLLTVFSRDKVIARGNLAKVVKQIKSLALDSAPIYVFNDSNGMRLDINFMEDEKAVYSMALHTYPELNDNRAVENHEPVKQRGRPKLGVVPKEITLLPRQWEWLSTQPGGASATIRRLVDEAKKANAGIEAKRNRIERAYKFLAEIAGNLPEYEESLRALFANDKETFIKLTQSWPKDIAQYAIAIAFEE